MTRKPTERVAAAKVQNCQILIDAHISLMAKCQIQSENSRTCLRLLRKPTKLGRNCNLPIPLIAPTCQTSSENSDT